MQKKTTRLTRFGRAGAVAAGLLLAANLVSANELLNLGMSKTAADACISELCLGAIVMPGLDYHPPLPGECISSFGLKGVKAFFDIKRTRRGKFSASRTSNARRKFLDECDSSNPVLKDQIIAEFGHVRDMPSGLF